MSTNGGRKVVSLAELKAYDESKKNLNDDSPASNANEYVPRCFLCHKTMEYDKYVSKRNGLDEYDYNIHDGIELTSLGEYGSTFWDEDFERDFLSIVICDECLRANTALLHVRRGKNGSKWPKPITYAEYDKQEQEKIAEAKRGFDAYKPQVVVKRHKPDRSKDSFIESLIVSYIGSHYGVIDGILENSAAGMEKGTKLSIIPTLYSYATPVNNIIRLDLLLKQSDDRLVCKDQYNSVFYVRKTD